MGSIDIEHLSFVISVLQMNFTVDQAIENATSLASGLQEVDGIMLSVVARGGNATFSASVAAGAYLEDCFHAPVYTLLYSGYKS